MFGKVALTERAAILAAACCALTASAVEVKVDLAKDVRPVKPMHAVGQPPLLGLLVEFEAPPDGTIVIVR